ncbi:MAG TPA: hypothetical protein VGX76_22415, partial [Pirellulales bacterium]|nr:hypothetical protein [Pirellulales bacterium]
MNEPEPLSSGNSNTARNRRVERVCDEFEAHLKAGSSPQLEDYLATAPPPDRRDLLGHLLALEVSYLADRGERPLAGAYHARFAEHSDTISKVFDSFEALASSRQPTDDLARVPHHAPQAGPSVVGSTSYSCAIGPGGVIAGRFQLVNRIGEGGMG